jgi:hypothetical protein
MMFHRRGERMSLVSEMNTQMLTPFKVAVDFYQHQQKNPMRISFLLIFSVHGEGIIFVHA